MKIRKTLATFAAAAAAVHLLAGCSTITSGVVVGKDCVPSHTYTTRSCGTLIKGVCYGHITHTHVAPEEWVLHLRDGDATGDVSVDEATFDSTSVGSRFDSAE